MLYLSNLLLEHPTVEVRKNRGKIASLLGLAEHSDRRGRYYETIGELPGIEIYQYGNSHTDELFQYCCLEYLIDRLCEIDEICCRHIRGCSLEEAWSEPYEFFTERGYKAVKYPRTEDIVVYGDSNEDSNDGFSANHFGIYRDGMVESKFGVGWVYLHELWMVSAEYGDSVMFFRWED